MEIKNLLTEHWHAVKKIYEEGIATSNATFQIASPEWEEWNRGHLPFCRLIATENNEVLGWVALTPVSDRCVYAGVAEISVYVAGGARGKGVGKKLVRELIKESERHNIWTLQARIFSENTGSIKIHEACGFRLVGRREKIGKMNGSWRDILLFEKRSNVVGIE